MKRRGPALFELINGGTIGRRSAPPAVAAPPPRIEVPALPPESDGGAENGQPAEPEPERRLDTPRVSAPDVFPHEPTPAMDDDDPPPVSTEDNADGPEPEAEPARFAVTPSVLLLTGAGVIAVCVLIWSIAYDVGRNEAEEAARRELRLQADGAVKDPLNTDIPLNTSLVKPEVRPPQPAGASGARPAVPPASAPSGDPREVGKNYLQLVTTDRTEADGIVNFLRESGIGAFHVPLDGSGSGANNRARFTVFCTRGITPEEFKADAPSRTELYNATGRLGKVWKAKRSGNSDLSGRAWSKYTR